MMEDHKDSLDARPGALDARPAAAPMKPARRHYAEPKLTQTGSIREITGGPQGGTLDTLANGTGGFQTSTS